MKYSKRQYKKHGYSAFEGGVGPDLSDYYAQEMLTQPRATGQGWTLANNALGTLTAWLNNRGTVAQQPTQQEYSAPTSRNNVPLFIGIGVVVLLIAGLVLLRKK